jgi:hypothetical protein
MPPHTHVYVCAAAGVGCQRKLIGAQGQPSTCNTQTGRHQQERLNFNRRPAHEHAPGERKEGKAHAWCSAAARTRGGRHARSGTAGFVVMWCDPRRQRRRTPRQQSTLRQGQSNGKQRSMFQLGTQRGARAGAQQTKEGVRASACRPRGRRELQHQRKHNRCACSAHTNRQEQHHWCSTDRPGLSPRSLPARTALACRARQVHACSRTGAAQACVRVWAQAYCSLLASAQGPTSSLHAAALACAEVGHAGVVAAGREGGWACGAGHSSK